MFNSKLKPGAGFFVITPGLDRVLVLECHDYLDVTKGCSNRGESPLQTAFRETYEEAGIRLTESDMITDESFRVGNLIMFLAISGKKPVVKPNPKTGRYEHDGAMYVPWRVLEANCEEFMIGAVKWAKERCLA